MATEPPTASKPSPASLRVYSALLLDAELQEHRERFCRTAATSLASVASWLGVDSFLGTGDIANTASDQATPPEPERLLAFRATAAVIELASQLAVGAIEELDGNRRFAAAALIRQLLETEYLLTAFAIDFSRADAWARSTPEEIRRAFTPSRMRKVGGFSNQEYWNHCTMGGHPSPSGRALLQFHSPGDDGFMGASMWGDLAQHLRRLWSSMHKLLCAQHARYSAVRRGDYEAVHNVEKIWTEVDPLAEPVDFTLLNALTDEAEEA